MKKANLLIAALLAATVSAFAQQSAAPAKARVEVIYDQPEKFSDVKDSFAGSDQSRDGYLGALKDHFEKQALRHLAPGQVLRITFTNVDMAGDFEAPPDIRVVKSVYPARLAFAFRLSDAAGATVKEGTRNLVDTTFQMRMGAGDPNRDGLFYEKELFNDWLREEFGRPQKKQKAEK